MRSSSRSSRCSFSCCSARPWADPARVLVALRPKDQPLAATTVRSIRRQHLTALTACVLGISAVLTFLYMSRGSIASVAASRVSADSLELQRLKTEATQLPLGDLGAMARSAAAIRDQIAHARDSSRRSRLRHHGAEQQQAAVLPQPRPRLRRRGPGILDVSPNRERGKGEHPAVANFAPTGDRCRPTHTRPSTQGAPRKPRLERASAASSI